MSGRPDPEEEWAKRLDVVDVRGGQPDDHGQSLRVSQNVQFTACFAWSTGFQDARSFGYERAASTCPPLRGEHPRQPRTEAHDHQSPNETRPPPRPQLQAPAPACGQGIRRTSPAEMAMGQAHRGLYRPQESRVQRTVGAPTLVIERTMSWLIGYRRLNHRYERHPRNDLAFLGLAAALCCYKRLLRLTT